MVPSGSKLLLAEEDAGRFSIVLQYGDGTEARLPAVTPAEDLIAAVETDYRDYRREVRRLQEEHPLFEERIDIPAADFEDFIAEALLLPSMLHETDPVSFFVLGELLHQSLQMKDDGTAAFFLNAGAQILRVLQESFRVQTYLRNIFEMTFDGTERASQQERFEKLRKAYPDIAQYCDPTLLGNIPKGCRVFSAHNLFGLRLLELTLYFQQEQQRIARCEYCWGYFIPRTKKATRYCDRVLDGFPCKKRGARFKRNEDREQDEALLIYKRLRDRMYGRHLRYEDAAPDERANLIPMDYEQYDAWSENARLAYKEYSKGKLTAEEFLRRIDTGHDLNCYEAGKAELVEETPWQQMVACGWDFDPSSYYPNGYMQLTMSSSDEKAAWQSFSAEDLRRRDQRGHRVCERNMGRGKTRPPLVCINQRRPIFFVYSDLDFALPYN